MNIISGVTSFQHFIGHVESCTDTEELIFTLQIINCILCLLIWSMQIGSKLMPVENSL